MIKKIQFSIALISAIAGAVLFFMLPKFMRQEQMDYLFREGFYEYPVMLKSAVATIRKDGYGKGYFGASRDGGRKHEGIDLMVPLRMPIFAAKSGRVVFSGIGKGYGKYVEILHPDGLSTRYAHLTELCVQTGDWVSRGKVIGTSGRTGNAANRRIKPHLHFEIRKDGVAIEPSAPLMNPRVRLIK